MENQFNVGDLVWAKLHGYPWWPSIIYNEALTSTQVQQAKKEGFMLVSFFGDNSYKWLDPKKLAHFESNYSTHSNRSSSHLFLKAVNEAVYEINHRAAIGLTCPCLFYSSYRRSRVEGFLEVDLDGYSSGGVYTVQQLNGFRQEFEPVQTLSFVQLLALDSTNVHQDLNVSKEVARVLAFRKAKYAEVDEPYFLAFKVDPNDHRTALIKASSDHPSEAETKYQKKPTIKYQNKNKISPATRKHKPDSTKTNRKVKRNEHDESNIKTSEDHVIHKKRHVKDEVEKKTDFISAIKDKQIVSSTTTTKHDDVQRSRSLKMPLVLSSQTKRKKEENSIIIVKAPQQGPKMVLSMKFSPKMALPSVSELKAKFVIFGPLDVSSIRVSYVRSRCEVVFMNKSDAERAYEYAVNSNKMFGQTNVSYSLRPKFPTSDLKEANTGSKETAMTPQHAHVTSHRHGVSFCEKTYGKYQKADQTCMQVNRGSVDISEKMMYLLNECNRIVLEMKQM